MPSWVFQRKYKQSPYRRELFKCSGLPFCNLHLSPSRGAQSIDHIPLQAGSFTVLPKEFILRYKLCKRKLNITGRWIVYTQRERGCRLWQWTSDFSFVSVTTPEHKGCEKAPQKQKTSQTLSTPGNTSIRAVTYCGANRKNVFELKLRCREEKAEPAAGLSKKQKWVSMQHKCFGERWEVTPEWF